MLIATAASIAPRLASLGGDGAFKATSRGWLAGPQLIRGLFERGATAANARTSIGLAGTSGVSAQNQRAVPDGHGQASCRFGGDPRHGPRRRDRDPPLGCQRRGPGRGWRSLTAREDTSLRQQRLSDHLVRVPFLDLRPVHEPLKAQILLELADLIDDGSFINGADVQRFEHAFGDFCGVTHCVGTASGLDALRIALLAAGLEPGEEVLVPAQTFVATFEAVTQAGGSPVPVDVSETDYCIDPAAAEAAVTERTRVVMPVHLFGQLADLRALGRLAAAHGIDVVEDACQAHGAVRDGFRAGAGSRAGAFSFYPGKNLGAMGDAGALVTDDEELAARCRALREHGQRAKYEHELEGYTARLDTIQALVLRHKLSLLEAWNGERRRAAEIYTEALDGVGDLQLPPVAVQSEPVWHLYVVRTAEPEALAAFLAERGISTARHYPEPPHLTRANARLGYGRGAFPVAEALAREALSLPIYPGISDEQLEAVIGAMASYFHDG
jgi:dTDP-4-amino-4,6-dideoxygalactose transaminase